MSEINDYKISLLIVPNTYDYADKEIIYRIVVNGQLISERTFPRLESNQGLLDTLVVKYQKKYEIVLEIIGKNILTIKKLVVNDSVLPLSSDITNVMTKGTTIKLIKFFHK